MELIRYCLHLLSESSWTEQNYPSLLFSKENLEDIMKKNLSVSAADWI